MEDIGIQDLEIPGSGARGDPPHSPVQVKEDLDPDMDIKEGFLEIPDLGVQQDPPPSCLKEDPDLDIDIKDGFPEIPDHGVQQDPPPSRLKQDPDPDMDFQDERIPMDSFDAAVPERDPCTPEDPDPIIEVKEERLDIPSPHPPGIPDPAVRVGPDLVISEVKEGIPGVDPRCGVEGAHEATLSYTCHLCDYTCSLPPQFYGHLNLEHGMRQVLARPQPLLLLPRSTLWGALLIPADAELVPLSAPQDSSGIPSQTEQTAPLSPRTEPPQTRRRGALAQICSPQVSPRDMVESQDKRRAALPPKSPSSVPSVSRKSRNKKRKAAPPPTPCSERPAPKVPPKPLKEPTTERQADSGDLSPKEQSRGVSGGAKERRHECPKCSRSYTRKSHMTRHMNSAHTKKVTFQCALCSHHTYSKDSLVKHIQGHLRSALQAQGVAEFTYPCPQCGKRFTRKSGVKIHVRTVHEKRVSFSCTQCGKEFAHQCYLARHLGVHSGVKPFQCETCGKAFSNSSSRKCHIARAHSSADKHQCPQCDKEFTCKGNLTQHMKVHTGVKPHQCQICGAKFARPSHLKSHLLVHSESRPFLCALCGRCSRQKGQLREHIMAVHLNQRPHRCSKCSYRTAHKSDINKHDKRRHP